MVGASQYEIDHNRFITFYMSFKLYVLQNYSPFDRLWFSKSWTKWQRTTPLHSSHYVLSSLLNKREKRFHQFCRLLKRTAIATPTALSGCSVLAAFFLSIF